MRGMAAVTRIAWPWQSKQGAVTNPIAALKFSDQERMPFDKNEGAVKRYLVATLLSGTA